MVFQEKALRQRASQSLARAASSRTGALPVDSPFTVVASGLLDSDAIPAAARTACLRKERRFMGSVLDLREATPSRRPGRRWRRLHSPSEGRRSNQRPRRPTGTHSCAIAWVKSNTFPREAQGSRGASTEGSPAEVCLPWMPGCSAALEGRYQGRNVDCIRNLAVEELPPTEAQTTDLRLPGRRAERATPIEKVLQTLPRSRRCRRLRPANPPGQCRRASRPLRN